MALFWCIAWSIYVNGTLMECSRTMTLHQDSARDMPTRGGGRCNQCMTPCSACMVVASGIDVGRCDCRCSGPCSRVLCACQCRAKDAVCACGNAERVCARESGGTPLWEGEMRFWYRKLPREQMSRPERPMPSSASKARCTSA